MATKKSVDAEDQRQTATDAVMKARFAKENQEPEKVKVTKPNQVLSDEEVWLQSLLVFASNLEVKSVDKINSAALLADSVLATFKKKFR